MGGRHYLLGQLLAAISAPGLRTRSSLFLPYFVQDLVEQWTLGRDFFKSALVAKSGDKLDANDERLRLV